MRGAPERPTAHRPTSLRGAAAAHPGTCLVPRHLICNLSMPHLHHLSCLSDENGGSVLLKTVGDLTVLLKTVGDLTVLLKTVGDLTAILKTVGEFLLCYCKQWECSTENLI